MKPRLYFGVGCGIRCPLIYHAECLPAASASVRPEGGKMFGREQETPRVPPGLYDGGIGYKARKIDGKIKTPERYKFCRYDGGGGAVTALGVAQESLPSVS